jgi:NAD-dependent SIR2 family protein deacetylase
MQQLMAHHNPSLTVAPTEYAPDGDAELDRAATRSFVVPQCESCGGILKPDVVFFGESVPRERVETAFAWLAEHEVLLVLGSSLTVYSGYRFADRIVRDGGELVIVNNGETRADAIAHLKIVAKLGDVLPALAERLAAIAS